MGTIGLAGTLLIITYGELLINIEPAHGHKRVYKPSYHTRGVLSKSEEEFHSDFAVANKDTPHPGDSNDTPNQIKVKVNRDFTVQRVLNDLRDLHKPSEEQLTATMTTDVGFDIPVSTKYSMYGQEKNAVESLCRRQKLEMTFRLIRGKGLSKRP